MTAPDLIRDELTRAARDLGAPDPVVPVLERPRDPSFGEWTTNLAMTLAKPLRRKPQEIAHDLIGRMNLKRATVSDAYVAGPGFINFRLDAGTIAAGLRDIVAADTEYGRSNIGEGRHVNVEFVSANPTGPLHVGHGRQAALGDAIASLLEWTGWQVTREFYYNDAGAQISNLTRSVQARIAELRTGTLAIPEGGYHGEYIAEIAAKYVEAHPDDPDGRDADAVRRFAVAELRREQDIDLQAFGVKFDKYFLESSLYTDGKVDSTVDALVASGHTYEQDGALFLRTTEFGDDKDRVMRRSAARGGDYTYFLPDVAYHVDKWGRGYRRAINVQGADHHSTVTRVRAGLQALGIGIPEGYPEYALHQMVTVMREGQEVKFSKRAGDIVTVRDLVEWVGRDAVRYFYLMLKPESQLRFDVDLARTQSDENPIYRIQMAHARMCGIFRQGGIDPASIDASGADLSVLDKTEERELAKKLVDFPSLVVGAAEALEPHRVAAYLLETAGLAHKWYHEHHVLDQPEPLRSARLVLTRATQIVLRNALGILGITAPERM
ncbi:MAG TPA: arginine--tRNA ligase [Gemmatimonadaceae bacterium]|nr:arginine--tRNA ligase [Gemmatimonadaceae bacterium]